MEQAPIFLVSSGRCGSTFFANAIHKHPDLLAVSELIEPVLPVPFLDNENIISGKAFFDLLHQPTMRERIEIWRSNATSECLFMPDKDEDVSLLLCYALPLLSSKPEAYLTKLEQTISNFSPASPATHFIRVCEWLQRDQGKRVWIERSGGSLRHCEQILKCWPNAKMIHFYRDGREVACSMRAHSIFRMFVKRQLGQQWQEPNTPCISHFGALWSNWVCDAMPALKAHESNVLNISYEEMLATPHANMSRFLKFVLDKAHLNSSDLSWVEDVTNSICPPKQHFNRLSTNEQKLLHEACKPGLDALGYA